MKTKHRRQIAPVRLHPDTNRKLRAIAAAESRSIGQVTNATLRLALEGIDGRNWYAEFHQYIR